MKITLSGLIPLLVASAVFAAEPSAPVVAGAYYFDGWTGQTDHLPPRLRNEFFDREPVWGWNDAAPEVMEQQINCAADHGLSFFAFDWYYPEGADKHSPLNTGLDLYLQSKARTRLQFCLLVANHGGFRIGPKDWDAVCDIWVSLFKEPTHLKVDGKPLLIFFAPRELTNAFGADGVKGAFEKLQEKARAAGLAGVCIAACTAPGPERGWPDLNELAKQGYSVFTGYNYHGYINKGGVKIQAFTNMVEGHADIWSRFAEKSPLPYMPVVTTGWDKRPWEDASKPEKAEVYYPDRTPAQVKDFASRAVKWMDAHPEKTTKERVMLLYAWNENGEGGYLTPTKVMGDAYLKAVQDALPPAKR